VLTGLRARSVGARLGGPCQTDQLSEHFKSGHLFENFGRALRKMPFVSKDFDLSHLKYSGRHDSWKFTLQKV